MSKKPGKEVIASWIKLHQAHRLLLQEAENALKINELPPLDWYDVLLELDREKKGLRQYEIAEKILLSKHNLSRLIDRLEKNSLVRRYPCEEDGRGNQIRITSEGEKMLKQMWPVYSQVIQGSFGAKLSSSDIRLFARLMDKLIDQEKTNE